MLPPAADHKPDGNPQKALEGSAARLWAIAQLLPRGACVPGHGVPGHVGVALARPQLPCAHGTFYSPSRQLLLQPSTATPP